MCKKRYNKPETVSIEMDFEESLLLTFSQVDNDGDGETDQWPIYEDENPEDDEIG